MRRVELSVGSLFHHVDGKLTVDLAGAQAAEAGDDGVGAIGAEDDASAEGAGVRTGEGNAIGIGNHAGYGCAHGELGDAGAGATKKSSVPLDAADEVEDGIAVRVTVLEAGLIRALDVHLRESVDGDLAEEIAGEWKAGESAGGDATTAGFLSREGFRFFEQKDAQAGFAQFGSGGGAGRPGTDYGDIKNCV